MRRVMEGVLKLLTKDFSNLNIASIIACFRLRVIKYAWGTLGCSSNKDDFWRLLRKPQLILAPTFCSLQWWPVSSINLQMNLYFVDDKILIFQFQGQKIGLNDARWLPRTQQQFFAHLFFLCIVNEFSSRRNCYLIAINLHDRCPSSISASKVSHVTENRNWFWV